MSENISETSNIDKISIKQVNIKQIHDSLVQLRKQQDNQETLSEYFGAALLGLSSIRLPSEKKNIYPLKECNPPKKYSVSITEISSTQEEEKNDFRSKLAKLQEKYRNIGYKYDQPSKPPLHNSFKENLKKLQKKYKDVGYEYKNPSDPAIPLSDWGISE